jgi:enoyl-CoA hydratase/carnithine racemase
MLLTGRPIDAARALDSGLVNRVVPAEALDEEVAEIVAAIARSSPLRVGIGNEAFYAQIRARRAPRLRPHEGGDGDERTRRRRAGGHVRGPG